MLAGFQWWLCQHLEIMRVLGLVSLGPNTDALWKRVHEMLRIFKKFSKFSYVFLLVSGKPKK